MIGSANTGILWSKGVYNNGSSIQISGLGIVNFYNSNSGFNFNSGNSFTITSWVYLDSGTIPELAVCGIVGRGRTTSCNYALELSGTTPCLRFGQRSGGTVVSQVNTGSIEYNTWYHVAGVYDASTYTNQIYLNGISQDSDVFIC